MHETSYDTGVFLVRKKVKNINLLVTAVGTVIWTPAVNEQFMVLAAFLKIRKAVGTNTDAPAIKLTNSTVDIVATVDIFEPFE